jgi:light-regulated signal transduction histidine kinase (bacteriophytochrome)
MIKTKFNVSKYQELVIYFENKSGDFLDDPLFSELSNLQISVESQIFYTHKNDYFDLIQKYLNKTISSSIFAFELMALSRRDIQENIEICKDFEQLSNFWIDEESDYFSFVLHRIINTCMFQREYSGTKDELSQKDFYTEIEKSFFKLQKYLNK